jgi:hypothetical protein
VSVSLDTLEYARRLREAGFSEQQAEGQARALAAAMTDALATKEDLRALALATKQDLRELESHIDARFAQVDVRFARVEARFAQVDVRIDALEKHLDTRLVELEKRFEMRLSEQKADLRTDLANLERRVTFRLGGIMVASVGVFSALIRIL